MVRFGDDWVVDRTMFEYVSGGSCACCGITHLFNPDGLKGLVNAVSDLETDAAHAELSAAERSPWPPQMRDQVWADRVRLRAKMKMEMQLYKQFLERHNVKDVERWCLDKLEVKELRGMFQMPRNEISECLTSQYNIHSSYAVVLCAVAEQVANFPATKYDTDGRSPEEVAFECALSYDRRGGFVLPIAEENRESVMRIFLDFMMTFGGPKLLTRENKAKTGCDDDDDAGGADEIAINVTPQHRGPSFRSDRRIVRLVIARYWARRMMEKYTIFVAQSKSDRGVFENSEKTDFE